MKKILAALIVIFLCTKVYSQECNTAHLKYTSDDYMYSCRQDVNDRQQDRQTFLQILSRNALTTLAEQFQVNIKSAAVLDKTAINGKTAISYNSLSQFSTDMTLKLAQVKTEYNAQSSQGWAIAFIDKKQARTYYINEYNKALSRINTSLANAKNLINMGYKIRARDEELKPVIKEFDKAGDAVAWLNLFGYPDDKSAVLLKQCSDAEQEVKLLLSQLQHGVAVYLQTNASLDGNPYRAFADMIKGKLEKLGCNFVTSSSHADWIINIDARISKTVHHQGLAYFAYADGTLTVTNAATMQVIFQDALSALEDGHPDGIKGDGDTRSFAPSARSAYKKTAEIVSEKITEIIKQ